MIEIPELAAGGLAAGTLSALFLGGGLLRTRRQQARQQARQHEEIATLRSHLDVARQEVAHATRAFTAEVAHLAQQRIPAEATRAAHPHIQVPGPLHADVDGSELGAGLEDALEGLRTAIAQERKRVDAAARAGMRGATREIQAGLYRLQDVLRGLQQRYDDPELTQTLFTLDHENEQSLRRAQVAAVVCGAWVGLAREESHLVEAVTGGQARLVGYHRVRVHHHLQDGTALVSHAVEPVAIIVAELLDNALRHSSPDTDVVVNLERAHHGVTVTIDDAGVGMATDERAHAQRMVAGKDPILLSELGDPPRMGLAAIGQLTRQFDLSVDLSSPSPYGGVRAVLLVRSHLLSHIDPAERRPAASAPRSTRKADPKTDPHAEVPSRPYADDVAPALPAPRTAPDPYAAAPDPYATAPEPYATAPDPYAEAHTRPDDPAPAPAARFAPASPESAPHPAPEEDVLPRRRRRVRPDVASAPRLTPTAPATPARTPDETAAALGALQAATAAARGDVPRTSADEDRLDSSTPTPTPNASADDTHVDDTTEGNTPR
ncbi:ATP-binding protein [Streptomyces apocyni]|uniref:ATP-binding protein n=1 Tax=Streptomyces apocyni TaxID=2654677 RepID=UPI0012EA73D1|nr:ATP-binding protein [Streptomyces apocyni]